MENVIEQSTFLPNPDAEREQCVEVCAGCNKMFSDENIGDVCVAYISPKAIQRLGGCALQSNKVIVETVKKKINPIKLSKRARKNK